MDQPDRSSLGRQGLTPHGRYTQNPAPNKRRHTPPSSSHDASPSKDHLPGHKTSLLKFKKIEIIPDIFPDQKGIKLEIGREEKPGTHKYMEIEPQSLEQSVDKEEITREIRKYVGTNENGAPHTKTYEI